MALRYSTLLRNDRCDAIKDAIDLGTGAGAIEIYDGAEPTNVGDAPAGTKLAELTFSDPSAAAASGGVLTSNAITDGTGLANGTASWFRVVDSDDTVVIHGDVGAGEDLILNTYEISIGLTVSVTQFDITEGNE